MSVVFTPRMGADSAPPEYSELCHFMTIIFQTNQNEQHGGQAIPAFDFFMAISGVYKSFVKHLSALMLMAKARKAQLSIGRDDVRHLVRESLGSIGAERRRGA